MADLYKCPVCGYTGSDGQVDSHMYSNNHMGTRIKVSTTTAAPNYSVPSANMSNTTPVTTSNTSLDYNHPSYNTVSNTGLDYNHPSYNSSNPSSTTSVSSGTSSTSNYYNNLATLNEGDTGPRTGSGGMGSFTSGSSNPPVSGSSSGGGSASGGGASQPLSQEQQAANFSKMVTEYNEAKAQAAVGDPTKLRQLDQFFGVTRPEAEYSADFYHKLTLLRGDGPILPDDGGANAGNGAAVYVVNSRGERFHVTAEGADAMRAAGTWTEPQIVSQAQVDAMALRFDITSSDMLATINSQLANGYVLVRGDGPILPDDGALNIGNGAAVYAMDSQGNVYHVTAEAAQEMQQSGQWVEPTKMSQASVDAMNKDGRMVSVNNIVPYPSAPTTNTPVDIPEAPVSVAVGSPPTPEQPTDSAEAGGTSSTEEKPLEEGASGAIVEPVDKPEIPDSSIPPQSGTDNTMPSTEPAGGEINPTTESDSAASLPTSYVRDTKDSGFAYPWSAAKSTGTTDIMGTIDSAVNFMNTVEGKQYQYDKVKGTIKSADGKFITRDDVQSLNNIIVKYHKDGFKLPEQASDRAHAVTSSPIGSPPPAEHAANGGSVTSEDHKPLQPTDGMARIEDQTDGLKTLNNPAFGGAMASDSGVKLP